MSGSGNSDFSNNPIFNNGIGGFEGGNSASSCELLQKSTQLISPQPKTIESLLIGDRLTLQINKQEGFTSIEAYKNDDRAGGIVLPQLLTCMENGHKYIAIVESIIEGQVQVSIKHI
ncbi:hypothetical protein [Aggregatibacter actinomycetemcomitans]|nr:hypothetical protein [Aggregatibacter actinomycetemcomitans]AMQ92946.1 hypothetical protein ACT74_10205 [Aggregatibacter actinomycetemcomitans]KND82364.1 hypothetical protein SCC1398_0210260 [Aggregatibacter actinomycetemcomitans serotype b str. SCC1398]KOE52610.1 hypothetical protein SCC4092_0208730 [Aggregatibacter actinomycetemcomitans serotype b str. SCC4092]KOE60459.1 hypothetical protein AAS4A_0202890 [Aggregatibacter actinomycetemcomitans serotype c str. AAS4A]KOE60986.1 hypothetical